MPMEFPQFFYELSPFPWKLLDSFWSSQWKFRIDSLISSYPLENSLLIFILSFGISFPLLTLPWKFHTFYSFFLPTLWNFRRFALKFGPSMEIPSFFAGAGHWKFHMPSMGGGAGGVRINNVISHLKRD